MNPMYRRIKAFVQRQEELGYDLSKREFEYYITPSSDSKIFFTTGLPCLIPDCKVKESSSVFGELISDEAPHFIRFWVTPYDDCWSVAMRWIEKDTGWVLSHYTCLVRLNEQGVFESQPHCYFSKTMALVDPERYTNIDQLLRILWGNTVGNKNL
jgi:hypothetical protein